MWLSVFAICTALYVWSLAGGAFNLVRQQLLAPPVARSFGSVVIAFPAGSAFPCRAETDTTCADPRAPWWQHRDSRQASGPVQYRALGPGLVTEDKFAAALALLAQWPEGQTLLRQASAAGVTVVTSDSGLADDEDGAYQPDFRQVIVPPAFASAPTALLANILAHELQHAVDYAAGRNRAWSTAACIATEQAAAATEQRYTRWLTARFGALPQPDAMASLSASEQALVRVMTVLAAATPADIAARVRSSDHARCAGLPIELPMPAFPVQFSLP